MPRLMSKPNLAHLRSLAGIPAAIGFDQLRQVPVGKASSPHGNVQLAPFRNAWWFNIDSTLCQCSHTSLNKKAVAWVKLQPEVALYGTIQSSNILQDATPTEEIKQHLYFKALHIAETKPSGPLGQLLKLDQSYSYNITAHNPHQSVSSKVRIEFYIPDRLNQLVLIGSKLIHFNAYYNFEPGGGERPN